ncbi:MAG: hypothetical protein LAT66_09705, partial [Alkalimonas sp.]|nr:hypothetical protein [Alkalimonas sp.]
MKVCHRNLAIYLSVVFLLCCLSLSAGVRASSAQSNHFLFDASGAIYWQEPPIWFPTGQASMALMPSAQESVWWRFYWDGERWRAEMLIGFDKSELLLDQFNAPGLEQVVPGPSQDIPWLLLFSGGHQAEAHVQLLQTELEETAWADGAEKLGTDRLNGWTSDGMELMNSSAANLLVGHTTGQFRVDESGAAAYSIPLALPEGIAGVQPELALHYSRQGGEGYLGRGWQRGGQS